MKKKTKWKTGPQIILLGLMSGCNGLGGSGSAGLRRGGTVADCIQNVTHKKCNTEPGCSWKSKSKHMNSFCNSTPCVGSNISKVGPLTTCQTVKKDPGKGRKCVLSWNKYYCVKDQA